MKTKTYLFLILCSVLLPTLAYAGFINDIRVLIGSFFEQEQIQEQVGAFAICYPEQGCTGTSTTPHMGDLLVGASDGTYGKVSSSTDYYMLKVDETAPYGLSWTNTIGSASNRLDAYLDNLDATTLTVSGVA